MSTISNYFLASEDCKINFSSMNLDKADLLCRASTKVTNTGDLSTTSTSTKFEKFSKNSMTLFFSKKFLPEVLCGAYGMVWIAQNSHITIFFRIQNQYYVGSPVIQRKSLYATIWLREVCTSPVTRTQLHCQPSVHGAVLRVNQTLF